MSEVFDDFFGEHNPARVALSIGEFAADALVEIEAIAM
jgi:enamine deaminase RidA (YjgF/YER057c/UK114 family)